LFGQVAGDRNGESDNAIRVSSFHKETLASGPVASMGT
jgi:hypothetical protein